MLPSAALIASMAPSKRPILISDERLLKMLPFVPRFEVMVQGVKQVVIPGEFLEALLNDFVTVGDSILGGNPIPWASARWEIEALRNVLVTADTAGLEKKPYPTPEMFMKNLKEKLESLPLEHRPVSEISDLEVSAAVDFDHADFVRHRPMRWIEELSVQDLIRLGDSKTTGWGMLSFAVHPCFEPEDRYSSDSAFTSVAGQWYMKLVQEHFVGGIPTVRPGVLRSAGLELLWRAMDLTVFLHLHLKSELRETELMNLMGMASLLPPITRAAFQAKIKEIVDRFEYAGNVKKLIGNTGSVVLMNNLYAQLCQTFGISDSYSLNQLRMLDDMLAHPRLEFLDFEPGMSMSDAEKVRHVTSARLIHGAVAEKARGAQENNGRSDEQGAQLSTGLKIQRLEKLHLTARHQTAVREITEALDKPGSTKLSVREAVFKQGIPLLNRHMLGRETAVGCEIYERLLGYRCKPGTSGDTDEVMGYFFGQQLMRDENGTVPKEYRGFSLAGSGVVDKILNGKLDEINYENDILGEITLCKSNMLEEKTASIDRFLDYVQVDRMIEEVSPIFEALGLGSKCSVDSFAAVLNECKVSLLAVRGLDESDIEDLLRGDRMGVQKYVLDALKAANSTVKSLFQEKDPLAVVEHGRLLPRDSQHFKHDLSVSRTAIHKRKSEQILFGSAYKKRTSGTSGGELEKVLQEVRALKDKVNSLQNKDRHAEERKLSKEDKTWKEKKKSADKQGNNKTLKRRQDSEPDRRSQQAEDKATVDLSDPLIAKVTDSHTGKVNEYKVEILKKLLKKIYKFTAARAEKACLGFGMDARRTPALRMLSCACGDPKDADAHSFPSGFTFAVRDEYRNFR